MPLQTQARPIRIRIISGGDEHTSLESLRQNFYFDDIKDTITDGRLERWLNQIGETDFAEFVHSFEVNDSDKCLKDFTSRLYKIPQNEDIVSYCYNNNYNDSAVRLLKRIGSTDEKLVKDVLTNDKYKGIFSPDDIKRIASPSIIEYLEMLKLKNEKKEKEEKERRQQEEERRRNNHEAIDLGLSVRWASCNIGADKPEDRGAYHKYTQIKPTINTYGEHWRIPTKEEWNELMTKCSWTWESYKHGYKVQGENGNSIFLPSTGFYIYDSFGITTQDPYNEQEGFYWVSPDGYTYSALSYSAAYRYILNLTSKHCFPIRPVLPK